MKLQYWTSNFYSVLITDFWLKLPIFIHEFSGSLHLLLLLSIFISWVFARSKSSPRTVLSKNIENSYKKPALFLCFSFSVFNLVLCLLNFSYFYKSNFRCSEDISLAIFDFFLRALAWSAISIHLFHSQNLNSTILRVWWGFFFSLSFSSFVIEIFVFVKHISFSIEPLVSDFVSLVVALFFLYVNLFVKKSENANSNLEEPLLNNGNTIDSNSVRPISPYSKAGIFSLFSFSWMGPLVALGSRKTLDPDDVPHLDFKNSAFGTFPKFKNNLSRNRTSLSNNVVTTSTLFKAIVLSEWKEILRTAFLAVSYAVASNVGPYLIDSFVHYLNEKNKAKNNNGYILVSIFLAAKLVECVSLRQWIFGTYQIGLRVRAALVATIYEKGLTLSSQSKKDCSSGEIINVMTVDSDRIGDFCWYMHDPWSTIVQVLLAMLVLYKNLGLAALSSLLATVLVVLTNTPLAKSQEKYQDELMKSKDARMRATSEVLKNMRILKLQAWEMKLLSKIFELRRIETCSLKRYLYSSAMSSFVFWSAPAFVSMVTFATCLAIGTPLDSGRVLSALAIFKTLQDSINNLPDNIAMMLQAKVSLHRIASFVGLEESDPNAVQKLLRGSSDMAIEIVQGNFSWECSSSSNSFALKEINLKVIHGDRVAICGTVGSGKSSLLSCFLGEMPVISGSLKLCGTKAYVAQSPWIQSGTIEENILFGKEMERDRYEKVLEACCLEKDLEIFSFGDKTLIGEKGINLSGGQKQRIQIARALYQDADIYLFDDPFSAVDAHTGSHLFKECLLGLLSSKTVIYVTHQVEFLPSADLILVLRDGRISQAGKYEDIVNSGADFIELIRAHEQALSTIGDMEKTSASKNFVKDNNNNNEENIDFKGEINERVESKGQLVQEEVREKGKVSLSVYWRYLTIAYRGALVPLIILAQVLYQVLQIGGNYWLAWASPVSENVEPLVDGVTLITVYTILASMSSLCDLARALLLVTSGYKITSLLFEKMHLGIFRAPMSFFDATPSGRILNRASTDQTAVDLKVWYYVSAFAFTVIQLFGIIAVMSQVAWQVFIVFVPVVAIGLWYQRYYISSARELARLEGVCKAPVIQHFSETISGSTTIRSFDQETRFREANMNLMDAYSRPKFYNSAAMEWLCFRLDMLSSLTFAFSLIFLISIPDGVIDPGIAGLAITYGLNLNMAQAWVIWNLCNMENKMISVERILQYTNIPTEPPLTIESSRPDRSWPSDGHIEIRDLRVRYAPHLPLVLRGLTCNFLGGTKTGIVGRTGSGKSTMIQSLFRIVEPDFGGRISIDGIDISSIGLHDLRSRLSIIPQDPTMFEGTIRSNLDPLEEYTDDQIWQALDKCQLGDEVRKKEEKLDSTVNENGENWSMGQRQLVCLGRVLLKKSKILVLDEATASVDTATDNLIQRTLRQHFSDCTVITIAHRITSVLDSDMVLLLSQGLIEEHDSPARLLENKWSSFSQLVAEYTIRSNISFG